MNVSWTQIVTAIVAVYGAIMSTVTFVVNRRDKKRKLEVKFSNGSLTYGNKLSELMLFINVSNPGNRAVKINVPRIILPDGKTIVFPNPQSDVKFPHLLEEGRKCMVWAEMKYLAKQLKDAGYSGVINLKADVEAETGKRYTSQKTWKLDIEEWAHSNRA